MRKDAHSNNVIHRFPRLFAGDFLLDLYHNPFFCRTGAHQLYQ